MFNTSRLQELYKRIQEPSEIKYQKKFQAITMEIFFNDVWKEITERFIDEAIRNCEKKLKITIN